MSKVSDEVALEMNRRMRDAFGCGEVYQNKADKQKLILIVVSFAGLGIFVLIGSLMASFGPDAEIFGRKLMPILLGAANIFGISQALFSLWILHTDWTGNIQYCLEASSDHHAICKRYKDLLDIKDEPPADWDVRYAILQSDENHREKEDRKRGISEADKVFAYRKSLIQFRDSCGACEKVPNSMKFAKTCSSCGG